MDKPFEKKVPLETPHVLKQGVGETKGFRAQHNNAIAAKMVAAIVNTSLGPRGMDKMFKDGAGVEVTNDGYWMMWKMDLQHPVGKMLKEASWWMDITVGDGTKAVIVFACALIEEGQRLIEMGVHPIIIVDAFRECEQRAEKILTDISMPIDPTDPSELLPVVETTLRPKGISSSGPFLARLAVDAGLRVADRSQGKCTLDPERVVITKKSINGVSVESSTLVNGVALWREPASHTMPKVVENPRILLLNCHLGIKRVASTESTMKVSMTIDSPEMMKKFQQQEKDMLAEMLEKVEATGANVVFTTEQIADPIQILMGKKKMVGIKGLMLAEMTQLSRALGTRVVKDLNDLSPADVAGAELLETRKLEEDYYVFITGLKDPKALTLLLRAFSFTEVEEVERGVKDAIMTVKDLMEMPKVVAGGGAPEAEIAYQLRSWAPSISNRRQLAVRGFATALESIPLTLMSNAGMELIGTLGDLKAGHANGNSWIGVDGFGRTIADMKATRVLEPLLVKLKMLKIATETATTILRVDDIIQAPPAPRREVPDHPLSPKESYRARKRAMEMQKYFKKHPPKNPRRPEFFGLDK